MEPERATSLRRGLDILVALGESEAIERNGLGVVRLAERVGGDKSRVSRTLRTLAEYGFVERDDGTLAYRLGWRLLGLAGRSGDARLLQEGAVAVDRVADELGEGAHLAVLAGARVLTIISRASEQTIQATGWVGRTIPAHCTSAGRVLLLDHDGPALARLFAGEPLDGAGPNAPRTLEELEARIASARAAGFAAVDEESAPGLVAVAAPVRDHVGRVVAALNVSAPKFRFGARLEEAGETVRAAGEELSRALGWRPERSAGVAAAGSRGSDLEGETL